MSIISKHRTTIPGTGAGAWSAAATIPVGAGIIGRVFASIDPTVDGSATLGGTGAGDLAIRVADSSGRIVLEYTLTPADPALTLYSDERTPIAIGSGSLLVYAQVDVDAGGLADGRAVVEVTLES